MSWWVQLWATRLVVAGGIGWGGAVAIEGRTVQFGAAFVPEHQGMRFGSEYSAAVAPWARTLPEIDWAICEIPEDHEAAGKALTRAGFAKSVDGLGPGFYRFALYVGEAG